MFKTDKSSPAIDNPTGLDFDLMGDLDSVCNPDFTKRISKNETLRMRY